MLECLLRSSSQLMQALQNPEHTGLCAQALRRMDRGWLRTDGLASGSCLLALTIGIVQALPYRLDSGPQCTQSQPRYKLGHPTPRLPRV